MIQEQLLYYSYFHCLHFTANISVLSKYLNVWVFTCNGLFLHVDAYANLGTFSTNCILGFVLCVIIPYQQ